MSGKTRIIVFKNLLLYFFNNFLYMTLALVVVVLVRIFLVEIYKVPSASMENAIYANDLIWVDKLTYGALIPNSLNQIPLIGGLFNKNVKSLHKNSSRAFSFGNFERNDNIVFFSLDKTNNSKLVKRIIGLPNEIITIRNNKVTIDSVELGELETYKFDYITSLNTDSLKLLLGNENNNYLINNGKDDLHLYLSVKQAKYLNTLGAKLLPFIYHKTFPNIFPKTKKNDWNYQNYGPIWIPEKDKTLKLCDSTFYLYSETIENFEGVKIRQVAKDQYYINGKKIYHYRFKHNYYYVLGDNRLNAIDSRDFGFLPEYLIIGKAKWVLFRQFANKF